MAAYRCLMPGPMVSCLSGSKELIQVAPRTVTVHKLLSYSLGMAQGLQPC
jgi:hypothetical protein